MKNSPSGEKEIAELKLTLEGELMEGGSIEYRTLIDIVEGTAGSFDALVRITNLKSPITFNVKPPKEKCFEIVLEVVQWVGATAPLWPQAMDIKNISNIFLEYLKIKKALNGEELKKENVQTNNNGDVSIKNGNGKTIYVDKRKIVNVNVINNAASDPLLNKKIDKIVTALEKSQYADKLSLGIATHESFTIEKSDVEPYKYQEKIEERPDSIVGYIRKIDNKTNHGTVVIFDDEKETSVNFEVDIKDIRKLEKIISNLALAEANRSRVLLVGEKTLNSRGKIKKIIVNDIDVVDNYFFNFSPTI